MAADVDAADESDMSRQNWLLVREGGKLLTEKYQPAARGRQPAAES
jgi:hypothetical protein